MNKNIELRTPKVCPSFYAGHNVHWIQAKQLRESLVSVEYQATIKLLRDNRFQINVGEDAYLWFHHDPERLIEAIVKFPEEGIRANLDERIIKVRYKDEDYLFSMSNTPLKECNIN